jgi:hypothetical protein
VFNVYGAIERGDEDAIAQVDRLEIRFVAAESGSLLATSLGRHGWTVVTEGPDYVLLALP